jgi:hypothetical protein
VLGRREKKEKEKKKDNPFVSSWAQRGFEAGSHGAYDLPSAVVSASAVEKHNEIMQWCNPNPATKISLLLYQDVQML